MDKILEFPAQIPSPKPEIKKPLNILDVENIGFLVKDDRSLWIKRPEDMLKIMRFIIQEKIAIIEEESLPVD